MRHVCIIPVNGTALPLPWANSGRSALCYGVVYNFWSFMTIDSIPGFLKMSMKGTDEVSLAELASLVQRS